MADYSPVRLITEVCMYVYCLRACSCEHNSSDACYLSICLSVCPLLFVVHNLVNIFARSDSTLCCFIIMYRPTDSQSQTQ